MSPMKKMIRKERKKAPAVEAEDVSAVESLWDENRKALLRKRREILREAKDQIADSISGDIRQSVDTALDEGDFAEINIREDINLRRLSIYRDVLVEIDEALRKIDEGSYGICEECGNEIGRTRLAVMPGARYCIDCQEAKERIEKIEHQNAVSPIL